MSQDLYEGKSDHDLLIMIHTSMVNHKERVENVENTLYEKPNGICAEVADLKGKIKTIAVIGTIVIAMLPIGMWIFDKIIH